MLAVSFSPSLKIEGESTSLRMPLIAGAHEFATIPFFSYLSGAVPNVVGVGHEDVSRLGVEDDVAKPNVVHVKPFVELLLIFKTVSSWS